MFQSKTNDILGSKFETHLNFVLHSFVKYQNNCYSLIQQLLINPFFLANGQVDNDAWVYHRLLTDGRITVVLFFIVSLLLLTCFLVIFLQVCLQCHLRWLMYHFNKLKLGWCGFMSLNFFLLTNRRHTSSRSTKETFGSFQKLKF